MNIKRFSIKLYVALSLLILVMLGLAGCGTIEVGTEDANSVEADAVEISAIEIGIEPTPMPENLTYTNDFYGFKFDYPETWTLKEKYHRVELKQGTNTLQINFRWANEDFNFGRTGMAAGTPIYSDKIIFMREVIPQYTVELDHRAQYVIYSGTTLVEVDNLVFGIILEDTLTDYNELDLPDEVIAEAKTILESFERIEATGTPGESAPTPEATVIIPVSPNPDWLLYTNADYDFGFYYPPDMTVVEEPNLVKIGRDSMQLLVAFRNIDEDVQIVEPMEFTGQTYPIEEIDFLARELRVFINSYDERVKAVYFGDSPEQDDGSLVTAIHLRDTSVSEISAGAEISESLIDEMTSIVKSFGRFETPSLPEVVRLDLGGDPVFAWLGHIASAPEGSRFDNMIVLSPQGTGQIGLTGATPEIEAEINSLRDAEGPNEYVHIWGTLLACTIDNREKNNCELVVERMQSGANYSEEEVHDWFGTIKKTTFNGGESYVFELLWQFPMWYGIDTSQDESLQFQLAHFFETGERVQMSGLLMVGVPDVNGTRIEISSIQDRSHSGFVPDNIDSSVYENREYGFQFTYPSYMSVMEEPNKVFVLDEGKCQMTIAYRRAEEDTQITDVSEVAGQLKNYAEVYFLGSFVQVVLNIQDGYITAAYLGEPGVELGEGTPLRFVISMVEIEGGRLSNSQVDWMRTIFENFALR